MTAGERGAPWRRAVFEWGLVTVGSALTALALAWFLIPNQIAAGGISGLGTVLYHLAGVPVGLTMLVLNIPLFLLSLRAIGILFGARTVFGTVATALFVDLFVYLVDPLTTDTALATLYGGALSGVGLGLAFRGGGSTGGTDMAARLLNHYFRVSVGRGLLLVDGFVIMLAGYAFGAELALYALLGVFLTSKTVDLVQEGEPYARAAFIISERAEQIGKAVLAELDRGATSLKGRGLYTDEEREVLFVIVSRSELARLRALVVKEDPDAFVVIADVFDVLGEGFRQPPGRKGRK